MKVVIASGSGFLGKILMDFFRSKEHQVIILSRNKSMADSIYWDGEHLGNWVQVLDGADVLINMAGRSVDCRYNEKNKRAIIDSRVNSTRVLSEALSRCDNPPPVWLNAGSATIYRHSEYTPMDEAGEPGEGFSVEVCQRWEEEFYRKNLPGIRRVALRISMVMGTEGGIWPVLKRLTKLGLGGTMGPGTQYISWIHSLDFCRAVEWLIAQPIEGPVNICAPNPVTNAEFMQCLRKTVGVPFGLPQPNWLLEIGAFLLRTETELVLKSRRVVPSRLVESDFIFGYKDVESAMKSLVRPRMLQLF
jgi:uncharacterized protein